MKIIIDRKELDEIIRKHLHETYGIPPENIEDIKIKDGCLIVVNEQE